MKYIDNKDRMSCYIRTYLYICPVIAGDVVGNSRSAVNLKQCSKQELNFQAQYGLAFVSTFIIKNRASCRDNVDATKINMSLNVFSAFAEYTLDFPLNTSFTFMLVEFHPSFVHSFMSSFHFL